MRRSIAENKNTPVSALEILARDRVAKVRKTVARHRKASLLCFEILVKDKDAQVRYHLAVNRSTPAKILQQLAKDKTDKKICHHVYHNPNISLSLKKELEAYGFPIQY